MRTEQSVLTGDVDEVLVRQLREVNPQLTFVFGPVERLEDPDTMRVLKEAVPEGEIVGCSTAGEISDEGVFENSIVLTGVHFDKTCVKVASAELDGMGSSFDTGASLGRQLDAEDLKSVLVIAQGVDINGSSLISGITSAVGSDVVVTGGLAGDNGKFERTVTVRDEQVSDRMVLGVGFYGDAIDVAHGSFGGWEPFGPTRRVTRSEGNVLYELDGQRALGTYRDYLGEYADDLPASGLLFPLALLDHAEAENGLIRTLLSIDEEAGSLIMAGDVPQGAHVRFMHADTEALVAGAETAARAAAEMQRNDADGGGFSILVSCIGRKLVMGGNVDDEVEAVSDVFGRGTSVAGFYSYGEISPHFESTECRLHNQTMTISVYREI